MAAGNRSLKDARQYLPYVYVSHQRNITTLYLYYIDYKIVNNTTASLRTIVDTVKKSYDKLPVDVKNEYSQLVTEVKALWLQKKNRGEITPTSGTSSAAGEDSTGGRLSNMGARAVDDAENRANRVREHGAVRFNGFLSKGPSAVMNDVLIFADVIALINEPMPNRDDWLVSEICLTSYSIKRGLIDTYHVFVDPGQIWLGYRAQFNEHNESHHIPEFFQQAVPQSKLDEVYGNISQFVRTSVKIRDPNVLASGIIPVICGKDQAQKVDYALNEFVRESYLQKTQVSPREVFKFETFTLDQCLMALYTHSITLDTYNIDQLSVMAELEANKTQFDNMPHLMCVYHDDTEAHVCAMSSAKKMCYTSSSALKGAFDFQLTADHMPEQARRAAMMASSELNVTMGVGQGANQDYESMSTGGSDFRGAPQGGVASTIGGTSSFGATATQFSSDDHSQTGASDFSLSPQQHLTHAAEPGRYQRHRGPASTISASTFITKDTPRLWGGANTSQQPHQTSSASVYRPFEGDEESESIVSGSTLRTATAISSGVGRSKFRGQPQFRAPPGPPGVTISGSDRTGCRGGGHDDDDDDDDDDVSSLVSSMASMGRGRGRGRGFRVQNQV